MHRTILIDIDDTIADLMGGWLHLYNEDFNDDVMPDDIKSWAVHEYIHSKIGEGVYNYLIRPDLYDYVVPISGALENIVKIRKMGNRIIFVTSTVVGANGHKLEWLYNHDFLNRGKRVEPDYVELHDKYLLKGDILIDDKPENIIEFEKHTGPGLLFDRPHNQGYDELARVHTWEQIYQWFRMQDIIDKEYIHAEVFS